MSVSSVHLRFCILLGAQTANYKIKILNSWLSVSAVRRTELSVIGYNFSYRASLYNI